MVRARVVIGGVVIEGGVMVRAKVVIEGVMVRAKVVIGGGLMVRAEVVIEGGVKLATLLELVGVDCAILIAVVWASLGCT